MSYEESNVNNIQEFWNKNSWGEPGLVRMNNLGSYPPFMGENIVWDFAPKIKVKKLDPAAKLPHRAHANDSGLDLFALKDCHLYPNQVNSIRTGIALAVPPGYGFFAWDKSSMGKKGLKVMGGVLDADYRDEVLVMLYNLNDYPIEIAAGQKIAQIVVQRVELLDVEEVEELDVTERNLGGFGSSGSF